jgi:hypothetical protein
MAWQAAGIKQEIEGAKWEPRLEDLETIKGRYCASEARPLVNAHGKT